MKAKNIIWVIILLCFVSSAFATEEGHGVALTDGTVSGTSWAAARGMKISIDSTICIYNITRSSSTTGNQCVVGNYTGAGTQTTLMTGSGWVSDTCTLTSPINLTTGNTYALNANNTAGTYDSTYSTASQPTADSGNIKWLAGFRMGNSDDSRFYGIESVGFTVGACPATPAVTNFTFTANNTYDAAAISSFNITVDGVDYTTSTGSITTHIQSNDTVLYNYNFSSNSYYTQSGTINASNATNEDVQTYQAILTLQGIELITNDTLTGVAFNSSAQSGTTLYIDAGTIPISAVKSGYYNQTKDFTVTGLTNTTVNFTGLYNSKLTLYAWDYVNATQVSNFSYTIEGLNETYTINGTASGESVTINLIQDSYNVSYDHSRYVPVTTTIATAFATTLNQSLTPYNSINFSFVDQETDSLVNDREISITLLGSSTNYQLNTSTGNLFVAELAAEAYTIAYGANGYDNRTYYFSLVNRTTNALTLYMLNSSGLTTTYITIIDEYGEEVEGAVVKALKYNSFTNSYLLQEAVPTNFEGVAIMDLEHNTGYYYFVVESPAGTAVKTTTPTYIYSTTLTIQIVLEGNAAEDYYALGNIYKNLYFDEDNDRFVFVYDDGANLVSQGCIDVYRARSTGDTFISRTCASGAANTLAANVTNGTAFSYRAEGIVDIGEEYVIDEETYTYPLSESFGVLGLFFTALLMIVFASLGFTKDISAAAFLTPIPLVLMNMIGFIQLSWGIVISVQLVGIILSFVLARNTN